MTTSPKLFDTTALAYRRARADGSAWFLHDSAIEEIHERLSDVNRQFTKIAIVGWRAQEWADALNLTAHCVPDTETLDLETGQYDLIINAMNLHWANDPVGQLVQMKRALQPDGLMLAAMLGGQTLAELRVAFAAAEMEILDGISPRIAPMAEVRALGGLLQRAGLALPVADNLSFQVSYENPIRLMHDLRAMGETNVMIERLKKPMTQDLIQSILNHYAEHFCAPDGRIIATFELVFLTGWAPSETQQKPLQPGSAKTRLADVLGVTEADPEKD